MRILGIDFGQKRIGIAISDPLNITAQPVDVIDASNISAAIKNIRSIIDKHNDISEIIIGLPKTLKGEIGRSANKVLEFKKSMEENISIPIKTWDERMTTFDAKKILIQANIPFKKGKKVIDKIAAVLILQGYLDSIK